MTSYKIYINDNSLTIGTFQNGLPSDVNLLDEANFNFLNFYQQMDKGGHSHYAIVTEHPKVVFKALKNHCLLIKAAGGLVRNAANDYLFIFRNKKWDLPKGKVEKGEKMREAAVREVEEECGVTIASNGDKLCKTYHIYEMGGKVVLKKTNWYDMTVKGQPKLIPQKEEGISKAGWYGKNEVEPLLDNTYQLISDVLRAGKLI